MTTQENSLGVDEELWTRCVIKGVAPPSNSIADATNRCEHQTEATRYRFLRSRSNGRSTQRGEDYRYVQDRFPWPDDECEVIRVFY